MLSVETSPESIGLPIRIQGSKQSDLTYYHKYAGPQNTQTCDYGGKAHSKQADMPMEGGCKPIPYLLPNLIYIRDMRALSSSLLSVFSCLSTYLPKTSGLNTLSARVDSFFSLKLCCHEFLFFFPLRSLAFCSFCLPRSSSRHLLKFSFTTHSQLRLFDH